MTKIEALKKTIYNLENNLVAYKWTDCNTCNCGVLAVTITGVKDLWEVGFGKSPKSNHKYEPFCGEAFCITTNLPLPIVFQSLKDIGFTIDELDDLESLKGKKILNRIGKEWLHRVEKENLIIYLKAWVEILEEEKLNSEQGVQECDATKLPVEQKVGNIKTKIVYVSVPETITKSLPETILS